MCSVTPGTVWYERRQKRADPLALPRDDFGSFETRHHSVIDRFYVERYQHPWPQLTGGWPGRLGLPQTERHRYAVSLYQNCPVRSSHHGERRRQTLHELASCQLRNPANDAAFDSTVIIRSRVLSSLRQKVSSQREIYETFPRMPTTDDTPAKNATQEGVYAKYTQYVAHMKNHIRATVTFNRRKQDAGETFDNFVTNLRFLVKDCGYAEENPLLRDAI